MGFNIQYKEVWRKQTERDNWLIRWQDWGTDMWHVEGKDGANENLSEETQQKSNSSKNLN